MGGAELVLFHKEVGLFAGSFACEKNVICIDYIGLSGLQAFLNRKTRIWRCTQRRNLDQKVARVVFYHLFGFLHQIPE